ncbi:Serine/threonine-protein phosphatase BSU1 [Sarcoptes scabiei]|nr:Serine/threonine-protein phosphatase BSU1 [Sarcoptes scabiei]
MIMNYVQSIKFISNLSRLRLSSNFKWVFNLKKFCDLRLEEQYFAYRQATNESIQMKRSRLLYQSRKRGMLENDLLLATFAHKYLDSMSDSELDMYDRMINLVSNEWDLYYYATGSKEIPSHLNNSVMDMFVKHVLNENREKRFRQPDLRQ